MKKIVMAMLLIAGLAVSGMFVKLYAADAAGAKPAVTTVTGEVLDMACYMMEEAKGADHKKQPERHDGVWHREHEPRQVRPIPHRFAFDQLRIDVRH